MHLGRLFKIIFVLVFTAAKADLHAQTENRPVTKARTAFNALPRGLQRFDGVDFRIRAPINIIGSRAAKAKGQEFARVTDTQVNGRGKYIHVLHTGDHGASTNGMYIWRLVLHYADGETRRHDFAYGSHIRNYWRRENEMDRKPADADSAIVWVGTSEESDRRGSDLVVSRTTITNDRPQVDIVSADYVSLLGDSSAYVFAVSIGDSGPKAIGARKQSATAVSILPFQFRQENKAATNVVLNCRFEGDGFAVRLAPARQDARGAIEIDVPTERVSLLHYEARDGSDHVQSGQIEIAPGDTWRPHVVNF
jgi:hypothetical protein